MNAGYNFASLEAIEPYLEPTAAGASTQWAQETAARLACIVHIGYPEITSEGARYNSTITVSPQGGALAHYRKTFLYLTDERWAMEGDATFFAGELPGLSGLEVEHGDLPIQHDGAVTEIVGNVAMGICMDINPYKFAAPWDAYEFANHIIANETGLVVLSMAWLSVAAGASEDTVDKAKAELQESPLAPQTDTLSYWAARFQPLVDRMAEKQVVLVMANRTGVENDACYAGSSTVMRIRQGEVHLWDVLGKGEEGCLIVDTKHVRFRIHDLLCLLISVATKVFFHSGSG